MSRKGLFAPHGRRPGRALAVAGVLIGLALSPAVARAQLVDMRTDWKTKQGLPTYCPDMKEARFVAQGPGKLTMTLTLTPYRSAGKMAYIPMTWTQYRPDGSNSGWGEPTLPGHLETQFFIGGREIRNFVEGAPLEMRRTWMLDAKRYDMGVRLGAPCQSFGGGGFGQFGQAQHLVIAFAGAGGAATTATQGAGPRPLFNNGNDGAVMNGPTRETAFVLRASTRLTKLTDYHWNNGQGAPAGSISLRGPDGRTHGPWRAALQGKAYWVATPDVILPPGRYVIVDSDPSTWSQNSGSGGAGMSWGEGIGQ